MYRVDIDKVTIQPNQHDCIFSICVDLTTECPGSCPYCLRENSMPDASTEQILQHLKLLAEKGVQRITWGGGEPMLRNDTYLFGLNTRQLRIGSLLATSGGLPLDVTRCRDAFDWIDISLDSINANVFEAARPGIDHDVVKANVKAAVKSDLRIRLNIPLTQINLATLRETVEWIASEGVKYIRLQPIVPRGRASYNWADLSIKKEAIEKILKDCLQHAGELGLEATHVKTVSEGAIVVLRPNGYFYIGKPTGLEIVGTIEDQDVFKRLKVRVGTAQELYYATTK